MTVVAKTETVELRLDGPTRDLITMAAGVAGKSVAAFVTDAAFAAAQMELLDQRFIGVDSSEFEAIDAMIDQPPAPAAALVELFRAKAAWID